MNYEQLLEMIGIESGAEFEYFENFADLIENNEKVEEDALYKLFSEADKGAVLDVIENFFEEMTDAIPDDSTDIFTMLEAIKMALLGLLESAEDENAMVHFCEEIIKFRTWYSVESEVHCRDIATSEVVTMTMRDALIEARVEKLEGDKYHYDFNDCLDYELEEYIMTYADMAASSRKDDEDYDFGESYDDVEDYGFNN